MSKGKWFYWKQMICLCQDMVKSKKGMSQEPRINSNNKLNSFLCYETFSFPIFKYEITNTGHSSVMKKNWKLSSIITGAKVFKYTNWGYSSFLNYSISFLLFSCWNNFKCFYHHVNSGFHSDTILKTRYYVSPM